MRSMKLQNQQNRQLQISVSITYHLVCQKEDHLQAELVVKMVENIFKGWTESSKDKGVVITFCCKPMNRGDALANETVIPQIHAEVEVAVHW